jgi:hypothetical protein
LLKEDLNREVLRSFEQSHTGMIIEKCDSNSPPQEQRHRARQRLDELTLSFARGLPPHFRLHSVSTPGPSLAKASVPSLHYLPPTDWILKEKNKDLFNNLVEVRSRPANLPTITLSLCDKLLMP